MTSESISSRTDALISSIALLNAASFACEGFVKPLTFRTNCSAASRTSASVVAGIDVSAKALYFVSMPVPIALHVIGAVIYVLLGPLQFASGLRRRAPTHRWCEWRSD